MKITIPQLRADRLSSLVPTRTYAGGWLREPSDYLCIYDSHRFTRDQVRGATLAFYTEDSRFTALWSNPERYVRCFATFGWSAVVEPDYSLWRNEPLMEQLYAVYRMRVLSCLYQERGLAIVPNLTWSDARSYDFAWLGIPRNCPVAATECRSCGKEPENRALFLQGLNEATRVVRPETVLIYGGADCSAQWLKDASPTTANFVLLPSWSAQRDKYQRSLNPDYRKRKRGMQHEQSDTYISQ